MNKFGNFVTNEHLQFFLMIPVFLGALYVSMRITCAGVDLRGLLHSRPRLITCAALTVLGTGCLLYMFLSHLERQIKSAPVNRVLVWISGAYVAFFIYFLHALAVSDLLSLLLRSAGHREMPARLLMAFTVGIAVFLTVYGVIHARNVRTIHYNLSSEGRLSAPLRVVEVSDLHMGSVIGTAHVQRVVDAVNASHPDLVVFLGDQFNRTSAIDVVDAEEIFRILSRIKAPLGAYAVLGNHDPELDSEIYQQYLSESGITALDNGVLEIYPGNPAQEAEIRTLVSASSDGAGSVAAPVTPVHGALLLAGRTKLAEDKERVPLAKLLDQAGVMPGSGNSRSDGSSGSYGSSVPLPDSVSSDSDQPAHYLLVLDHDPGGITEAVSCDADLVLAGHTHRGQFFPTALITQFSYEKGYFYGLAQTINEATGHITTSVVSSGAGYFQTPIRIGSDSEIVCIDIR
ncbi:MAG: metallophosphoesterase [Eubacteriales bacterium]|nr:metallophosphoesterase [Eubacteriales bacterium]